MEYLTPLIRVLAVSAIIRYLLSRARRKTVYPGATMGKKIKLNVILNGFSELVEIMKKKLDESIYYEALKKYNEAYSRYSKKTG